MFGGSKEDGSNVQESKSASNSKSLSKSPSPERPEEDSGAGVRSNTASATNETQPPVGEKRSGNGGTDSPAEHRKRRSSGVGGKASSIFSTARSSLGFGQGGHKSNNDGGSSQTPLQKLGKQDPSLAVPQGQHNNAAGESLPGPKSTFRVGVWEDKNRKCRRTMEDTHAFLYNFLRTPAPAPRERGNGDNAGKSKEVSSIPVAEQNVMETDNGYFAVFDGHAGTFAADWCGKKLHIILEDIIRKNPNSPIPEVLDQTFTSVDAQLDKLPLKNSGCTAAVAVIRWEDRVPSSVSQTGSQAIAPAISAAAKSDDSGDSSSTEKLTTDSASKLKKDASRQRVLYTANVGDARIILCRGGKALRLSYDHKGSDEHEGKRIAAAGGLILNNRVNGVLAVTRALGDTYMKELVTGHPYTTETVIQPEVDEFMIIACDGLWDVCDDQEAVDLVRSVTDPVEASKMLVEHALSCNSTDNLSCMTVRFQKDALLESQNNRDSRIGVEGDPSIAAAGETAVSETEKIVSTTKHKIAEGGAPAIGVSASNSGLGHDPVRSKNDSETTKTVDPIIEEEPAQMDDEAQPNSEGKLSVADLKPPPPPKKST